VVDIPLGTSNILAHFVLEVITPKGFLYLVFEYNLNTTITEHRCLITLGASLHLLLSLSTFSELDFEKCEVNFEIRSGGANYRNIHYHNTTEADIHRCGQRCANVLQAQGTIID